MANRPRHPLPGVIKDLDFNTKSNKYEITELGITYSMEIEQTRLLKEYFRGFHVGSNKTVSDWYNKLPNTDKKRVYRVGPINSKNDFYPDTQYPD